MEMQSIPLHLRNPHVRGDEPVTYADGSFVSNVNPTHVGMNR